MKTTCFLVLCMNLVWAWFSKYINTEKGKFQVGGKRKKKMKIRLKKLKKKSKKRKKMLNK